MLLEYTYFYKNKKYIYPYKTDYNDFVLWFTTKYQIEKTKAIEIVDRFIDVDKEELIFLDNNDKELFTEICYQNAYNKLLKTKKLSKSDVKQFDYNFKGEKNGNRHKMQ